MSRTAFQTGPITLSTPGYSNEFSVSDEVLTIDVTNVKSLTATLTWTDEPDASLRHTNEPDEFELEVFPPNGTDGSGGPTSNPQGGEGRISVTKNFDPDGNKDPYFNGTGEYTITVVTNECGNHVLWRPGIGIFDQPDDGNAWSLVVEVEYYVKPDT